MDQLQGTLKQHSSAKNTAAEEETICDQRRSGSVSSVCSTKLDDLGASIQSLDSSLPDDISSSEAKIVENPNLGSFKRDENAKNDDSKKPDICQVRQAFWSRKNRFFFPSKRKELSKFCKKRKTEIEPKLGAVVSLAALTAGMTSMPIVNQQSTTADQNDDDAHFVAVDSGAEKAKAHQQESWTKIVPVQQESMTSRDSLELATLKETDPVSDLKKPVEAYSGAKKSIEDIEIDMDEDIITVVQKTEEARPKKLKKKKLDFIVLNSGTETWL